MSIDDLDDPLPQFGRTGNLQREVKQKIRPRRSKRRLFSAKDAGRIICEARQAGATPDEIRKEAGKCLGDLCERERQLIHRLLIAGAAVVAVVLVFTPVLRYLVRAVIAIGRLPLLARLLPESARALLLEESEVIDLAVSEWKIIEAEAEQLIASVIK